MRDKFVPQEVPAHTMKVQELEVPDRHPTTAELIVLRLPQPDLQVAQARPLQDQAAEEVTRILKKTIDK